MGQQFSSMAARLYFFPSKPQARAVKFIIKEVKEGGKMENMPEFTAKVMNAANFSKFYLLGTEAMAPTIPLDSKVEVVDVLKLLDDPQDTDVGHLFGKGDVVVIENPLLLKEDHQHNNAESRAAMPKWLMRRITAVPGNILESKTNKEIATLKVPTGKFWVNCDKEDDVLDSRTFGFVDVCDVKGRVVAIVDSKNRHSFFVPSSQTEMELIDVQGVKSLIGFFDYREKQDTKKKDGDSKEV